MVLLFPVTFLATWAVIIVILIVMTEVLKFLSII